jgi:hypothetical protein
LGGLIAILLDDVGAVHGASSETLRDQQVVQIRQGCERHARRADLHLGADDRIQHPRRHHGDHPGRHFNVDHLPRCAMLAVVPTEAPPEQRVPPVVDHHLLPDMGRMTPRSP